jgi:hypothetical protein
MTRNVIVFQKGNPSDAVTSHLERQVLTCWMVNNDMPNTLFEYAGDVHSVGNDSNYKLNNIHDGYVIVMEDAAGKHRFGLPETVWTDEQCRELYDNCYNRTSN